MGRVSRDARLLFILLWTVCDDEGRSRGASRMLASLLYPFDDDAPTLIDEWLKELEQENSVVRYEVDGNNYIQIVKWLKHQKIDKPGKSRLPSIREALDNTREGSRKVAPDLGPRIVGPRTIASAEERNSSSNRYDVRNGAADILDDDIPFAEEANG